MNVSPENAERRSQILLPLDYGIFLCWLTSALMLIGGLLTTYKIKGLGDVAIQVSNLRMLGCSLALLFFALGVVFYGIGIWITYGKYRQNGELKSVSLHKALIPSPHIKDKALFFLTACILLILAYVFCDSWYYLSQLG